MIYCGKLIYSTVFAADNFFQDKFWGRITMTTGPVFAYSQQYALGLVDQGFIFKEY